MDKKYTIRHVDNGYIMSEDADGLKLILVFSEFQDLTGFLSNQLVKDFNEYFKKYKDKRRERIINNLPKKKREKMLSYSIHMEE